MADAMDRELPTGSFGKVDSPIDFMPLDRFGPRLVDDDFWRALVASAKDNLQPTFDSLPPVGLILADDPLLGLAAASLFGRPDIHVPLYGNPRRRGRQFEAPNDAVNMHPHLRGFIQQCRTAPRRTTPSLMLAWSTADILGANDTQIIEREGLGAFGAGLFCLCDRTNFTDSSRNSAVVLELVDAQALVAGALRHLTLGDFGLGEQADQEEAKHWLNRLLELPDMTLGRVIRSLNKPGQLEFLREAQRLKTRKFPEIKTLFEGIVLDAAERQPRHVASLFLVSHFSHLSPRQFIELGDALTQQTPKARPARGEASPSPFMTDAVLAASRIEFARTTHGEVATVVSAGDTDEREGQGGGPARAEHLRMLFETRAPMLRERYLQCLADTLVLGHPSQLIASDYIRHEAQALRLFFKSDEFSMVDDRLRRIVYGQRRVDDGRGEPSDDPRRIAVFERALDRVPELLDAISEAAGDDRLLDAVRALCSVDASRAGFVTGDTSRLGSAWLFWLLYARYAGKVGLLDFPHLFDREAPSVGWRIDVVRALREVLAQRESAAEMRTLDAFRRADLNVLLIGDIVRQADKIVDDIVDNARGGLLAEAWTGYLRNHLRATRWREITPWSALSGGSGTGHGAGAGTLPCDLGLAKLLLPQMAGTPVAAEWITRSIFRARGTDEAALERSRAFENASALFDLARLVLDVVVGCAAFGDFEILAIDIWLIKARGLSEVADVVWRLVNFNDPRHWCAYCGSTDTGLDDAEVEDFRGVIDPVFDMFPVVALMAATSVSPASVGTCPDFVISAALRDWLCQVSHATQEAPVDALIKRTDACLAFQRDWRDGHGQMRLKGVDWAGVRDAMDDRVQAFAAFRRVLEPVQRERRPSPLAGFVRSAGAKQSIPANAPSAASAATAASVASGPPASPAAVPPAVAPPS